MEGIRDYLLYIKQQFVMQKLFVIFNLVYIYILKNNLKLKNNFIYIYLFFIDRADL